MPVRKKPPADIPDKTLYQQVEDCVETHILVFLFQLRVLCGCLFRNEVDGAHVEKLRLNMAVGGFMDEELTVMQLNEEMTGRLRSARPYNKQKWNVEMCLKGDDFPYIACTDTDAAGKAYPL